MAGELLAGTGTAPRHVYECCGLYPIAQVREPYSSIRLLCGALDMPRLYNLRREELEEERTLFTLLCTLLCTPPVHTTGARR